MRSDGLRGRVDGMILAVLSHGPAHGYEVVTRLRERSDGAFDLPEGTVYPVLHKLEDAGFLTVEVSRVNGRRRKTYALAPAGHRALQERRIEWVRFSTAMTALMGAPA